ncbi:hypothetical protein J6590_033096 [Homalodisca vitripennis]|nr:hypothetical protein J6590_033096 [Homalodisca vitripennis]
MNKPYVKGVRSMRAQELNERLQSRPEPSRSGKRPERVETARSGGKLEFCMPVVWRCSLHARLGRSTTFRHFASPVRRCQFFGNLFRGRYLLYQKSKTWKI